MYASESKSICHSCQYLPANKARTISFILILGGSGVAGAAASSTAGNAAGTPQAVAIADPSYALIAPMATIQVAASVIITALLTPVLTALVYKRNQAKAIDVKPVSELHKKSE